MKLPLPKIYQMFIGQSPVYSVLLLSGKRVQGSIITDFLALQAPPLKEDERLSGKNLFDK